MSKDCSPGWNGNRQKRTKAELFRNGLHNKRAWRGGGGCDGGREGVSRYCGKMWIKWGRGRRRVARKRQQGRQGVMGGGGWQKNHEKRGKREMSTVGAGGVGGMEGEGETGVREIRLCFYVSARLSGDVIGWGRGRGGQTWLWDQRQTKWLPENRERSIRALSSPLTQLSADTSLHHTHSHIWRACVCVRVRVRAHTHTPAKPPAKCQYEEKICGRWMTTLTINFLWPVFLIDIS